MKVSESEDRASYAGPRVMAWGYPEVRREAFIGEPVGQPLSRESFIKQGGDAVSVAEATPYSPLAGRTARALVRGLRTWHVGTLFAPEPGGLPPGRKWRCHDTVRSGTRGAE